MIPHSNFKLYLNEKPLTLNELKQRSFDFDWQKSIQVFVRDFTNNSNKIEVKTSGSTGTPKEISLQKKTMAASALLTGNFLNLGPGTKALSCLSADFIAGKMMLARAIILGWSVYCVEPTKQPIDQDYDFTAMVPMQIQQSLSDLKRVKKIIIGGGVVPKNLKNQLLKLKHNGLFQTFGMTETTSHIALKKIDNDVFTTLDGITISKTHDDCLVIDAPMLIKKPVSTNDVIELIDPTHFKWLGRKDNVINSGGIKLHPELIEEKLNPIITVPFFVASISDNKLGEKLILIIEGSIVVNLDELIEKSSLSQYEKPKAIYSVEKFARTKTEKINRIETLKRVTL